MYEITLPNLPAEFVNPPLYLMRHESKPKVMARRLTLAFQPTLSDTVGVAYRRRRMPYVVQRRATSGEGEGATAIMAPAAGTVEAGAAVTAAGPTTAAPAAVRRPAMGVRARVVRRVGGVQQPAAMPRQAVQAGEPVVRMYRYAPAGGFRRSVAKSAEAALAVRPKGTVGLR